MCYIHLAAPVTRWTFALPKSWKIQNEDPVLRPAPKGHQVIPPWLRPSETNVRMLGGFNLETSWTELSWKKNPEWKMLMKKKWYLKQKDLKESTRWLCFMILSGSTTKNPCRMFSVINGESVRVAKRGPLKQRGMGLSHWVHDVSSGVVWTWEFQKWRKPQKSLKSKWLIVKCMQPRKLT